MDETDEPRPKHDPQLSRELLKKLYVKYGDGFDGEGFISYKGTAYWVKKDGSYERDSERRARLDGRSW